MSKSNWFEKIPSWIWFSFIPVMGGLAHIYAGWQTKKNSWIYWGSGFFASWIILADLFPPVCLLIWAGQILMAFKWKQEYLVITAPKGVFIPSSNIAALVAQKKGQIDINQCTKDEMVYDLGLSIIYANDIELLRHEGYIFTDIDELSEVVGIPESIMRRIEPLIVFRYDLNKELDVSWRRLNSFSIEQLISYDIDRLNAEKIVRERNNRGTYQSLLDVRKRTGIPINVYKHLV